MKNLLYAVLLSFAILLPFYAVGTFLDIASIHAVRR